ERQVEPREALDDEARTRDVHDHARHELALEGHAEPSPAVTHTGDGENRQQHVGKLGEHDEKPRGVDERRSADGTKAVNLRILTDRRRCETRKWESRPFSRSTDSFF